MFKVLLAYSLNIFIIGGSLCVSVLDILECGVVSFTDTRDGVILCYIIEILIPAYLVLIFSVVVAINGVFNLFAF
jgi:hypothetical protein